MRVVLAGASGLLGSALAASLRTDGHEVRRLVRRSPSGPDELRWEPSEHFVDPAALADANAAVCLSGAGVGDHRWTRAYKQTLIDSRVDSVGALARAVATAGTPVFVAASAVGYYGNTGETAVDEDAPPGDDFLADLCVQWEAAAAPAREAGARVVHLRTGNVLSPSGGLLGRVAPIVRLGVGGRLGSGRQFLPWISLKDHVRASRFVLDRDVRGPVNVVAPQPARNAEFIAAVGRVLHRPTALPAPSPALRLALGEFANAVLAGQRALPAALTAAGFSWDHADLDAALRWALQ